MMEHRFPDGRVIRIVRGDITREHVDAIVNAANSRLAHGAGVAGAIARRGGEAIGQESDAWVRDHGPVPTGDVAVTGAGALPCTAVIHAVGPVWQGGAHDEEKLLASAAQKSLEAASERGFASIAMPAISSGIFGFPKLRCAEILLDTTRAFFDATPAGSLRDVRFVIFDQPTLDAFVIAYKARF